MTIGKIIRRARESKGWSQCELARRAHLWQQVVNKLESDSYHGKLRDPRIGTINALLKAMSMPTVEDMILQKLQSIDVGNS